MNTFDHKSSRVPEIKLKPTVIAASASLIINVLLPYSAAVAQDVTFKDFPYLIYCHFEGIDHAYYFSRLDADGVAIYITPDRLAGMITIEGTAKRVGGEQSGSCANKTLDVLRLEGQAYDLPR